MSDNRSTVLGFIGAMGRSDAEAAGQYLAEEAHCALMRHPYDHVDDRGAFLQVIANTKRMVPGGIHPEITSVIVDGDSVAVEYTGNGVTAEGKPYNNRYCWVFRLENGKITAINQYLCTVLATETFSGPFWKAGREPVPQDS